PTTVTTPETCFIRKLTTTTRSPSSSAARRDTPVLPAPRNNTGATSAPTTIRRWSRSIVIGLAIALGAGGVAAYASDAVQSGDPASAPVSPAAGPPVAAPTSTVPTSLQQSFSVLDQSSGSTDSSSDGALVVYGVNRALAQTVDVDGVGPVTVLPGSSGVC